MLMVSGIRIPLAEPDEAAVERAAAALGLARGEWKTGRLRKLSYDARRRGISKVCSVLFELHDQHRERSLAESVPSAALYDVPEYAPERGKERLNGRPVVVGFGPAGIFAAYALAEYGYRPLVLERGADADRRARAAGNFIKTGKLDPDSNVQFGEGGAGAFSDGKLTTRISDPLSDYVLRRLAEFGAPPEILYEAKPHIGTDLLGAVVKRIRKRIVERGGEIRFLTRVTDLSVRAGRLVSVTAGGEKIFCGAAIFAAGHSARDVFRLLYDRGASLRAKPFAVGLRVEHRQSEIDRCLWGKQAGNPLLPKAEYALSERIGGRAVYTFCMCPGGEVVVAGSERDAVVVNGMSRRLRDGENANSAVVAAVDERDFSGDPFAAIAFQRDLEQRAFRLGGSSYAAPAADMRCFLSGKSGLAISTVTPSHPLGVTAADLDALLGERIAEPLKLGILAFSEKIRCFDADDAILTGVESRTSSPVRVERRENREAAGIDGLYPAGEGAGYAGGIMSSAVDGLRTATAVIERFRPPD